MCNFSDQRSVLRDKMIDYRGTNIKTEKVLIWQSVVSLDEEIMNLWDVEKCVCARVRVWE